MEYNLVCPGVGFAPSAGGVITPARMKSSDAVNASDFASLMGDRDDEIMDEVSMKQRLTEKFGMRVTVENFDKDQKSLDSLGGRMGGNDLVIAPNILRQMAEESDKRAYYESKIQYWFDSIQKWKAESAAFGLTYEPCGVAIHEDGTVYYIGGGTETPERKAKIAAANAAKQKKKMERQRELEAYQERHFLEQQMLD